MSVGEATQITQNTQNSSIGGGASSLHDGVGPTQVVNSSPSAAASVCISPPIQPKEELETSSPKRRKAELQLATRRKRDLLTADTRQSTSSSRVARAVSLPLGSGFSHAAAATAPEDVEESESDDDMGGIPGDLAALLESHTEKLGKKDSIVVRKHTRQLYKDVMSLARTNDGIAKLTEAKEDYAKKKKPRNHPRFGMGFETTANDKPFHPSGSADTFEWQSEPTDGIHGVNFKMSFAAGTSSRMLKEAVHMFKAVIGNRIDLRTSELHKQKNDQGDWWRVGEGYRHVGSQNRCG